MMNSETSVQYAYERRRDELLLAERERQYAACQGSLPLARRAARPVGRALFALGGWLLRYGKVESGATHVYQPSAGSVKLN
jgi:hypothetical protein